MRLSMIRQSFVFIGLALSVSLVGCVLDGEVGKNSQSTSGSGASGGKSSGGAGSSAGGSGGGSGGTTGGTVGTGGGSAGSGGSATGGAGGGGGSGPDPNKPNPPAGYTKCGSGMFDNFHSNQICKSVWTDTQFGVLYDPKTNKPEDPTDDLPWACDDVNITTGQYEVWCSGGAPQSIYIWAKVDGIQQSSKNCPFGPTPLIPQVAGVQYFMEQYPKGWGGGSPGSGHAWNNPA